MNDDELRALEHPDEWDFEHAARRPGVKRPRAVVSVAFGRRDFERVSAYAERSQKRTSAFLREAALDKAASAQHHAVLLAVTASASVTLVTHTPVPTTRLSGTGAQLQSDSRTVTT